MTPRRRKSFDERRQELAGSIDIITSALSDLEQSGKVHILRVVASQLRALIVRKPNSSALGHPLLLELAQERTFPLTVYTCSQAYRDKVHSLVGESLVYETTGDPFSLAQDEIYITPMPLADAMETFSVQVMGQQLSVKDVLLHVADTEASHYDPGKPPIMDEMGKVELGGLPTQYRVVYALGRIVRDLGISFLQSTT